MRDIRGDLQERVRLIEDQLSAVHTQFEKRLEQLQAEREARMAELQADLMVLGKLMELEHRRMINDQAAPPAHVAAAQNSLADFIMRKLNEIGPLSKDDLIELTLREGFFADAESADRGVHATLVMTIRNEHIRQLHDGTFVPNTLPQVLRVRQAG